MTATIPERTAPADQSARGAPALTPRQLDILRCIANGSSVKETAKELCISTSTVKTHSRSLYDALGAGDRAHAVGLGFRLGLLDSADVRLPKTEATPPQGAAA
ncbi:response regulator transcription factor [Kitasatospora sp. HPMI-4]|uniref:response regulator transcription factor n=1 Tax=Kitasatospora sp. HPMI-4 TaxID=3448443 RepID=UPI003F1A6791